MRAEPERAIRQVFEQLLETYGPQYWWPADSRLEVIVGAVLTQNAAWINVEKAIANLRQRDWLSLSFLVALPHIELAEAVRPAGYFNVKANRLQNLARHIAGAGGLDVLQAMPTDALRRFLLEAKGVGPETADDIVLYAFDRPVFVIDAYTRRIGSRLGWFDAGAGYEELRSLFEANLDPDSAVFNEYHALIVHHAKSVCRKQPDCANCCFCNQCAGRQ